MFEHVQKWTPVSSKWCDLNEHIQTFDKLPKQFSKDFDLMNIFELLNNFEFK